MTLSGPKALSSLEEALRDIRREEDEINKRLARANERLAKLREGEAELFRKLAMVRLDEATQAELTERISAAEAKARQMLAQHSETLSDKEKALKGLDDRLADAGARRAEALAQVDQRQAELKTLSTRIAQSIVKDPAYAAQRAQTEQQQAVAEQARSKLMLAEQDREQKGRPYREDPLFMYLWERGYGTSGYKGQGLIAYLDAKVARLIKFDTARPNYMMLNEIPTRLKEHADRQAANAVAAEEALDTLETTAIDAAGGQPIRQALAAAQAEMEKIDAEIVALEDERDELAKDVRQMAQGSDPAFAEVLSAFAEGLGREDMQTLLSQARLTRTAQDDAILAQIDDLRTRMRDDEAETRDQRERAKTLETRRRELEDIQYEFKKARYDDPRSTFRKDELVGDLLTDFLRGGITAASYWEQWRRSQNWAPGSSDWGGGVGLPRNGRRANSDGGFSWPDSSIGGGSSSGSGSGFSWPKTGTSGGWRPSGGSSSGGGFSRPRTGSSGNRSSGGFKTGGKF